MVSATTRRPAPPVPRIVGRAATGVRRWTHPVTHPAWAALVSGILAAGTLPAWAPIVAAVAMWGEGRIWPDSRREWLSVAVGALCVGAVVPDTLAAATLSAVLATIEVLVEHTARGRAWERRRAIHDAWPAVVDAIGATDVTISDVDATRWRDRITISGPQGATMRDPAACARQIASALRRPVAAVTGRPGRVSGSVVIDVAHGDPLASVHVHPGTTARGSDWSTPLGVGADGRTVRFALDQHQILVAGCTGSGKTVTIVTMLYGLRHRFARGTAELWIVDMKGGADFARLEHLARRVLSPHDGFAAVLSALTDALVIISERNAASRATKRAWTAKQSPRLVIVLDEFGRLTDKACREAATAIARTGRSVGVHLIIGTQNPTDREVPIDVMMNCDVRVVHRTVNAQGSRNALEVSDPCATSLPKHGHCLMSVAGDITRLRAFLPPPEWLPRVDDSDDDGDADMLPNTHPANDGNRPGNQAATLGDDARQLPGNCPANDAPIGPQDGAQYVGAPARPPSGTVSPDIAAEWTGSAGLILGALDGVWRPIATVRADIGISERTWGTHARRLTDAGLIERDGTSVRLTVLAMGAPAAF